MNREDIIRMVREVADKDKVDPYLNEFVVLTPEELERFASLVAAAEREALEQVAQRELANTSALMSMPPKSSAAWNILQAIRARGQA